MKKFLPIIGIVVLLMLFVAPTASAAPQAWGGSPCDGWQGGGTHHCVRYGETLFSIGRLYGVNPWSIAQANHLQNPNRIYAGQMLYIPRSGGWDDCGWDGCRGWDSGWNDCGWDGCQNRGWDHCYGCGDNYYPGSGYGYDYTGYYYDGNHPQYKRYSYTCGYYHNCY